MWNPINNLSFLFLPFDSCEVFFVVKLMTDLLHLLQRLFFILLLGWENLVAFIEGLLCITLSFSILLLLNISGGYFVDIWFAKNNFKWCLLNVPTILIISTSAWKVFLNIVLRGMISFFSFGFFFFFNGISTLFRLFNVKAILLEEQ